MADREELLRNEETAWRSFVAEVGRVPEHVRGVEGVVPGWSVTDLVYHVGKWAGVGADMLALLREGQKAEADSDTDDVNRMWAAESKSMTYQEAMAKALPERERARSTLERFDTVDHEVESWFRDETIDHYLEHTQEISRFADSLGPGDAGYLGQSPGEPGPGSSN